MQVIYDRKATQYAEQYGIIQYKVKGNEMIYYQNYAEGNICPNGRRKVHCYKRVVNLDTMQTHSERMKKTNKDGWLNV